MTNRTPMPRASDFDPEVLLVFDQYVHGDIDRRTFLERLGKFAVGAVTAAGLLATLSRALRRRSRWHPPTRGSRHATSNTIHPRVTGGAGLLVRPAKVRGRLPLVLVVHENRGLNPHIEDVARRVALEKFIALAPDALFPLGGYRRRGSGARTVRETRATQGLRGLRRGNPVPALPAESERTPGSRGFLLRRSDRQSTGSGVADLLAAVPFYGTAPALETVAAIKAELLLHFAANDERVNATWPPFEAALKEAGVKYTAHVYPNTQHGFHNDTTPRYDPDAAALAWQRTMDLFNRVLRG